MKNILLKEKMRRKNLHLRIGDMRICLLFLVFQFICGTAYGQIKERISLKMTDATVEKVLDRIEKESGYRFLYSRNVVDITRKVSIEADREPVTAVLDKLFRGTDIGYERKDNKIVLSKKAVEIPANAKVCNIRGKITDETGNPLAGVMILVEGTTQGMVSSSSGTFEIKVPAGARLVVSFMGYITQYLTITKDATLDLRMKEDNQLVDEVVVVGYGTVSRKNLTTAVSTIKPADVNKAAMSNMSSLLLGRAAGLQATVASPQPDGRANISIRGGGTPIYVVDGIVMPSGALDLGAPSSTKLPSSVDRSGLNGLNPGDIESIEVLKDAAAAIYGIGASDGVILVTTKKGKVGRPTVTYEGSYSFVKNQPYLEVLDAKQYMMVNNVFNRESYLYANNMYPYGNNPYDGKWSPIYSDEAIANNLIDTDWTGHVLKSGSINNHSVTINGGLEKFQYYLGLNYFDQEGTVINSGMKRYVIRSNTVVHIFPFLKLNTTLNYNNNQYTNSTVGADSGSGAHTYGALQSALSYSPLLSIYDETGEYTRFKNIGNPIGLGNINDKTKHNAFFANFSLDIDILKNMLTAKLVYGVNSENSKRAFYIPSNIYFNEMYRSRGDVGTALRMKQTMEATVSFRHSFADIIAVDAVVGMGRYLDSAEGLSTYYENTNDHIGNDKIDIAEGPFYPETYKTGSEKRSQFIRASVDVLDRYVVSASLRRDGTDKFFPGKKYALFPSVSLAWKLSNEPFLRNVAWINMLKIRASYGVTGRDNLGASLYGLYKPAGNHIKFDENKTQYVPFIMEGRDYDDVSWEKTVMKNLGLDFSLLKDRIWGSFDIYRYDETNLLSYDPESWLSMFASRPVNGGHYKRYGFDISLNGKPVVNQNFEWETSLNISRAKLVWIERQPNYQYQIWQVKKNEPFNAYYYYKHTGIINSDRSNMPESQKSLPVSAQMPGYPIISDKNGDGIINEDDIYMDDDGQPKLYVGFGNTFKWKGFDLDIYMYGRFGIRRWNRALASGDWNQMSILDPKNVGTPVFDSYSSLTNPKGTRPGIAYSKGPALPGGRSVDIDVVDASFLRVRNITLGYNFTTRQLGVIGKYISSIRIYADVQNPLLFTKYPIFDPEIKDGGGLSSNSDYPQTRTFTVGARIVF